MIQILSSNSPFVETTIYLSQICSICGVFYATYRIGKRDYAPLAFAILAISSLLSADLILRKYTDSGGFYSSSEFITQLSKTPLIELPSGAEIDYPKENRALSIIIAGNAYIDHAKMIDYIDVDGNRVRFSPQPEDIFRRDEMVSLIANLTLLEELGKKYKYKSSIFFLTTCLLGYLAGTAHRPRSRRSLAD